MIIETIPHGAIPYRCKHCESMYLWTPSVKVGKCCLRSRVPECDKSECEYYEPEWDDVKCPFCKNKYDQERISALKYKFARAFMDRKARKENTIICSPVGNWLHGKRRGI